jgi:low affinity Fe/Cu permease
MSGWFQRFAAQVAHRAGTSAAFFAALATVLLWLVSGPFFGFSDTWQLVINTGTTVITFLMVFVIQATQNRDGRAVQLKLDELIRAQETARNFFADLEDASELELKQLQEEFRRIRAQNPRPEESDQ